MHIGRYNFSEVDLVSRYNLSEVDLGFRKNISLSPNSAKGGETKMHTMIISKKNIDTLKIYY